MRGGLRPSGPVTKHAGHALLAYPRVFAKQAGRIGFLRGISERVKGANPPGARRARKQVGVSRCYRCHTHLNKTNTTETPAAGCRLPLTLSTCCGHA
jgi:hypothetical protein